MPVAGNPAVQYLTRNPALGFRQIPEPVMPFSKGKMQGPICQLYLKYRSRGTILNVTQKNGEYRHEE
jgi:hypothetical protein